MTAPFRDHTAELDAAIRAEAQRIIDTRNGWLIEIYALHGGHATSDGVDRISEGARQLLLAYLAKGSDRLPMAENPKPGWFDGDYQ
jgi:hypothetical protein